MVPPGGFSRGEQFERERVVPPLSRLLCVLSCRSKKVRPRWQALAESRLENKLKGYNRVTTTTSKYHPQRKPELHPPLAPSVTCGDSSLPEGAMGCVPFHIGLCFGEVPAVRSLSQKSKIFASSLWQGSLFAPGIGAKSHLAKGAFGGGADTGRDFREEGIGKKEEGIGKKEEGRRNREEG